MEFQMFGQKKCPRTRKAERFFKERGVGYHFVDITRKAPSPGELEGMARSIAPEDLIDRDSKLFQKKGMAYMEFDPLEEILENPALLKTPVIRFRGKAVCGDAPEVWKAWIEEGA